MKTTLIRFDRRYLPEFRALNEEWIRRHFTIEPMDLHQLERAEENIIAQGGEIFFVIEADRAVATCAMVPHGPAEYELAKMAVNPDARGRGYGDLLMEASIDWAKEKGADRIVLLSNTALEPAIHLYRKHGFQVSRLGKHPDYERCDIEMVLRLK